MSFLDKAEKNVDRLMKEESGGFVAGFVGGAGMGIDALFAGPFHPDSGHGSQIEDLLQQQLDLRRKQRAEMEKQAKEDNIELVGLPDPIGGYYADIGETEDIELAYDELARYDEVNKQYSDEVTPDAETEWKEIPTNLVYDDPGEAYQIRHIEYDDPGEAYQIRKIVYDEPGEPYKMRHIQYDKPGEILTRDIVYDDTPEYAGESFINKSANNWQYIDKGNK